jgi:hypothetical protein
MESKRKFAMNITQNSIGSNFSLIIHQKEKKHVMRGKWFNVFLIVQ